MKSIIFSILLLAAGSTVCFAQCDKKLTLSASKTQHLDGDGNLKDTRDEKTTVEITKTDITVSITNDNGDEKMTGKVKLVSCEWKTPFKDGKMVISTALNNGNNEDRNFTITIEGNNGKPTL